MVQIAGTGIYAPGKPIDNAELERLTGIEFDADRLETRLGIRQRHIAHLRGIDETTADFAEKAARAAIADAEVDPQEIGLFVVATDTPEYISPATSMIIQGRIQGGQRFTGAYDVGASCASFVTALDTVSRVLATDPTIGHACVVGVYNMAAYLRPGDAFGYPIFADGAGAVVLSRIADAGAKLAVRHGAAGNNGGSANDGATESHGAAGNHGPASNPGPGVAATSGGGRYLGGQLLADGTQWNFVGVYSGGTRQPVTAERLASGEYGLQLLQRLPGDRNVKLWPVVVERLLQKVSLSIDDVDHFLFTQINRSVIEEVMGILGRPMTATTTVMDRFGYTGSACIPMSFHTAVTEGRIRRGDTVVMVASGAGLAVAGCALVY